MKFSIVIPVYNTALYLRECLDSIFSQDYHDCEVICVNDGSKDNSLDILNEYQQQYPDNMVVLTQLNQGQSVARNTALDIATGEYVVFLDSDDYFLPNAIKEITSLTLEFPQCDVIYVDNAHDSTLNKRLYFIPSSISPMPLRGMFDYFGVNFKKTPAGCVCGGIYKRAFLNIHNLRMLPGVQYEDELFVATAYTLDGIGVAKHLEYPYYYYRTNREGSTTTSLALHNFTDRQIVCRAMHKVFEDACLQTPVRKHLIFNLYLNYLCDAYLYGFKRQSKRYFDKYDLRLMRQCIMEPRDRKLVKLATIHPMFMAVYKTDNLPSWVRRFINRFL